MPGPAARWQALGPAGGSVTALAFDPNDPRTLLAGTEAAGLFRSPDGGDTWTEIPGSPAGFPVAEIHFDPGEPDRIFALRRDFGRFHLGFRRGAFCSMDTGATWRPLDVQLPGFGLPSSLRTLETGAGDGTALLAGSFDGVLRSIDGGATWNQVLALDLADLPDLIAIDPDSLGNAYAASSSGLYRSTDGGESWHLQVAPPLPLPRSSFAFGGGQPSRLYGGQFGAGMVRSLDGGHTWIELSDDLEGSLLTDPVGTPIDLEVLVGPAADLIYAVTADGGEGIFRSRDNGETWERISRLDMEAPADLAIDPEDSTRLLVGTRQGMYVSEDGGDTWTLIGQGLQARPIEEVDVHPTEPGLLFARDRLGILWRGVPDDDALQAIEWTALTGPDLRESFRRLRLDLSPADPNLVFVFRSGEPPMLRSDDVGLTFEPVPFPGAADAFPAVALHPTDPDRIWVAAYEVLSVPGPIAFSSLTTLWKTQDGGASWRVVWEPDENGITDLALDPFDPDHLWAATGDGLYQSFDGGETWAQTPPIGTERPDVSRVTVDPSQAGRLWATQGVRLYRSDDGGSSWRRVGQGLSENPGLFDIVSLTADPASPDRLLVGVLGDENGGSGLHLSVDAGETFRPLGGELPQEIFTGSVAVSPVAPGVVWAGTGGGVRRLALPTEPPNPSSP